MPRLEERSLLLIDTNLLLVLIVATVDRAHVPHVKRTKQYSLEDVDILTAFVSEYDGLLVTPHVLTEVSNLAGHTADPLLTNIRNSLSVLIPQWDECSENSREVATDPMFRRFGLTDTAIQRASGRAAMVLTDDLPLYLSLARAGVRVVNFNHLRAAAWDQ